VDVRVLSATNADLPEAVQEGRFREDLLYRLNTVELHLPALRERPEDVLPLAEHFLSRLSSHYGKGVTGFTDEAAAAMLRHPWPGNVRELEHAVERAVLMAQGAQVDTSDLGLKKRSDGGGAMEALTLEEAERVLIDKALDRHEGNVSKAAEALGLSRSALYRRLQRTDPNP
jgi:DNA-binding NtrC family response regulator